MLYITTNIHIRTAFLPCCGTAEKSAGSFRFSLKSCHTKLQKRDCRKVWSFQFLFCRNGVAQMSSKCEETTGNCKATKNIADNFYLFPLYKSKKYYTCARCNMIMTATIDLSLPKTLCCMKNEPATWY